MISKYRIEKIERDILALEKRIETLEKEKSLEHSRLKKDQRFS